MTYSLHMNIQTFAYSTIISPRKIYEQKKILTFAYEHTYIIIIISSELICRSYGSFGFLAVVPRPERQYRLSPQAVVPLSKAVVPPMAISGSTATVPRWYRLDFGSCIFRVEFCSSCTAVRHGSSTYKR